MYYVMSWVAALCSRKIKESVVVTSPFPLPSPTYPPTAPSPITCIFYYHKNPPRIQRNVDGILRRMAQIGSLPYLDWGDLKVLLAARMLEVVGALEKESGFVQAKGEKDYVQRR